jgi:organic hydroperoxide reductase OsmC/OhrA
MTTHHYSAQICWRRGAAVFTDNRYSRAHLWRFDGGLEVPASAAAGFVPAGCAVAAAIDPEEALVAAVSSCHMLWFLSLAAAEGFRVDVYEDAASGVLGRNLAGKLAMHEINLRPRVRFAGNAPDPAEFARLHARAHAECYIANSLHTAVRCEPVIEPAEPQVT